MEKRYQHTVNGQSVLEDDLNVLGESSALADDRVFAELLRLAPYDGVTVSRGVLPYATDAFVVPNGASGSVLVNPFRSFIGSRTAVATDGKANLRDVRSTIAVGAAALTQPVSISANASGDPRWDLLYAAVAVDANSASVTRKVKDPTTKVIAGASLVTTLETTVELDLVVGTPGATPAFPTLPTDSGGIYYIAIAYVRVPDGFGAATTVLPQDINEVAPVLSLARAMGVATVRPANQHHVAGGTAISSAGTSTGNGVLAWDGTAGARPGLYMPPSMNGAEQIITILDLADASSANWSHQTGDVVDDSVDWRNRFFRWAAQAADNDTPVPWKQGAGSTPVPAAIVSPNPGVAMLGTWCDQIGLGQSFMNDDAIAATHAHVAVLASAGNVPNTVMVAGTIIDLYVDLTTGKLHVKVTGVPRCSVFFWIEASAPYGNV